MHEWYHTSDLNARSDTSVTNDKWSNLHEFIWMIIHEWCIMLLKHLHFYKSSPISFQFTSPLIHFIVCTYAFCSDHEYCHHTIIWFDCWMVLSLSNQRYRNIRLKNAFTTAWTESHQITSFIHLDNRSVNYSIQLKFNLDFAQSIAIVWYLGISSINISSILY